MRKRAGVTVAQDAQEGEEVGFALNFVNDDQTLQRLKRGERLFQAQQADRVFQVEVVERIRGQELARQGGLAGLTRADEQDNTAAPQGVLDGLLEGWPGNEHGGYFTMKKERESL
jgi:hypothetical protein